MVQQADGLSLDRVVGMLRIAPRLFPHCRTHQKPSSCSAMGKYHDGQVQFPDQVVAVSHECVHHCDSVVPTL